MSERLMKLVERLHEKSRQGDLAWQKAPSGAFQISFPRYTISLSRVNWNDEEFTSLRIYNQQGDILENIDQADLVVINEDIGEQDYSIARKLEETYDMARRKALGTDKAVNEILEWLELNS